MQIKIMEFLKENEATKCPTDIFKGNSEDIILFTIHLFFMFLRSVIEFVYKHFNFIVLSVILFLVLFVIYKSYWSPVYYFKELTDVGYDHIPQGPDRAKHIARAQNARKIGSKAPPPYPNGWFALVESRDLKIGCVMPVDALGLNFCVYRGEDGIARIVDAYCPHLGANLGVGGYVCGNCIQCPFHQWKFGENGSCVSVPGVENVPKGISIKTYPTMEVDGAVWVWYDADGRDPLWRVEEVPELKSWGYRGRNDFLVNAHIQEIPENGADVAHLNAVHATSFFTDIGNKYPILNNFIGHHSWSAEWIKGTEEHKATINIVQKYIIMKYNVFPLNVVVNQIGPGHVRLFFDTIIGRMMVVQSVTPLAPLLQRVIHKVYTPAATAFFGGYLVYAEAYQFQRDVAIWNNKQYVSSPAYVKTDKSIRAFRTWFSQFYTENSIPLRDALQNKLDW
ncbi:cholesterol 7-desaturase nvd [Epargyreus clarus]|uniref:cholesterol 7-desaturase nvd n=1 Tax=Epargyreus clarus TaxID=520877 RepID=UPI003C2AEB30